MVIKNNGNFSFLTGIINNFVEINLIIKKIVLFGDSRNETT